MDSAKVLPTLFAEELSKRQTLTFVPRMRTDMHTQACKVLKSL
ncbi:phosphoribosylaminoimidazole-succinocarboxamides ynthase [Alicyclobacillus hesperidum URH17-3-68]|nr:phosphoribosylaminoimidazole-succinocarboxamides ynthase [Alicyclobacillus hesperidum URH17-3-68]